VVVRSGIRQLYPVALTAQTGTVTTLALKLLLAPLLVALPLVALDQ